MAEHKDGMRDSAYAWEEDVVERRSEILEDHEADTAISLAWTVYGFSKRTAPDVEHTSKLHAYSYGHELIKLPTFEKLLSYSLHEAAHCIASKLGHDSPDHSREWMGIYCNLLILFKIIDRKTIVRSSKAYGLDVAWSVRPVGGDKGKKVRKSIGSFVKSISTTRVRFDDVGISRKPHATKRLKTKVAPKKAS